MLVVLSVQGGPLTKREAGSCAPLRVALAAAQGSRASSVTGGAASTGAWAVLHNRGDLEWTRKPLAHDHNTTPRACGQSRVMATCDR